MVQPAIIAAAGVGGGLIVAGRVVAGRIRRSKDPVPDLGEEEDPGEAAFVCERVCTSEGLLRRMGGLVRDPIKGTCITVCGTSQADACVEACQRAVCVNQHAVPAWNEACLKRCTAECTKGRTAQ